MTDTGIVVIGVGEVRHAPSILIVRIGVSVTRKTVRQATEDATAGARAVIAALHAQGVAQDDVQTANVTVGPFHEHSPGGPPRLVGYTFTNTVSAIVRDLERAGAVLDAALRAGGDDVVLESVTFAAPDDNREVLRQARTAAFEDALSKAQHLASLAGVSLGSPLSIDETGGAAPVREMAMARMAMSDAPPIAAGQMSTSVRLRVTFAIV